MEATPSLISYPARPVNGGRLEDAPPKVGPWIVQPKIDDWRAIVHTPTKRIWNRHGEPMSINGDLAAALLVLQGLSLHTYDWLDVGVMERRNQLFRGTIIVFDFIPHTDLTQKMKLNHAERRALLMQDFDVLPEASNFHLFPKTHFRDRVFLINEFVVKKHGPHGETMMLYKILQAHNRHIGSNFYEGIVCKRTDKPYPVQLQSPNKESPWMIKHRFDQ